MSAKRCTAPGSIRGAPPAQSRSSGCSGWCRRSKRCWPKRSRPAGRPCATLPAQTANWAISPSALQSTTEKAQRAHAAAWSSASSRAAADLYCPRCQRYLCASPRLGGLRHSEVSRVSSGSSDVQAPVVALAISMQLQSRPSRCARRASPGKMAGTGAAGPRRGSDRRHWPPIAPGDH